MWRPFLNELWAALHTSDLSAQILQNGSGKRARSSHAPRGCIWTVQIMASLCWINAFLKGNAGAVARHFSLKAWASVSVHVKIIGDASPWGMGA
eukprot:4049295-Karenia_brevis.AAC.1